MITNSNVESLSVSEVNIYLAQTGNIAPYIATSNTVPLWDGEMLVYNNYIQENRNIDRLIKVQVKGHIQKNNMPFKKRISFRVKISDLDHYRRNGGICFFVVYFKEIPYNYIIYYALLTPEQLKAYIRNSGGKKQTNIILKEIPNDKERFYWSCINFLDNRDKQSSFQTNDLAPMNIIGKAIGFSLTGPAKDKMAMFDYFEGERIPLYALYNNDSKTVSIPTGIEGEIRNVWQQKTVTINGKKWYDEIKVLPLKDIVYYDVGNFLVLAVNEKNRRQLVYADIFNGTPLLSDILKSNDFVLNLIEVGHVEINGIKYKLDFSSAVEGIKELLKQARLLRMILDRKGINDDLALKHINVFHNESGEATLRCCINEIVYDVTFPDVNWEALIQAK